MNRVYLADVASYAKCGTIGIRTDFSRFRKKRRRSTFVQFFQLRDKLCARQVSLEPPKFLSIAIENDERGKSVHVILARELLVLLFQFSGLLLPPRTARSEERRVGKEGRSRCGRTDWRKR